LLSDLTWDEEESQALRQARKDAELTASADSAQAYLKRIGKVALLNAEEEVELAQRIEAGLYAAERVRRYEDATENSARSCAGTWLDRPRCPARQEPFCRRLTFASSSRWPSATPAAACHFWT
jgi:hypothetical protein